MEMNNNKHQAGKLMPVVDFNKCEAKDPCIKACPHDVFEMQKITDEQFSQLTLIGKVKTIAHGREKAIVVKPDQCHSCGLCITACPEKAIKLVRFIAV